MDNYLKQIDELIEQKQPKNRTFLVKLSSLIISYFGIETQYSKDDFLFDKENDKSIQHFISYCLIRIIGNDNYIQVEESKHKIYKFISHATPEMYTLMGINDKTETYEKGKLIGHFMDDREKEFNENLIFEGEISDISKFQHSFRRAVNSKKNIFLEDFTGDLLTKPSLDKIFTKLNEFIVSKGDDKYDYYKNVIEILDQCIDDANKIGTKYSRLYISNTFCKIKETVKKDMEKSPFIIPAELDLFKTEKKYPFTVGSKNSITIGVRNRSQGYAQDVVIRIINYNNENILIDKKEEFVGNIKLENVIVEFNYEVISNISSLLLVLEITWKSSYNNTFKKDVKFRFESQTVAIDWESSKNKEPYNLEPVQTEPELIGREAILQKLKNMQTLPIGSSYVFGQRRVGKTSIVKTLMDGNKDTDFLIYYIEAGDWNDAQDASNSMNNLGEKICKKIKRFKSKFSSIPIPNFQGSFNKITDFFDEIEEIDKDFKLVIILDEFDRISRNLYERGEIGQSFVLTLRSISNRRQFGFILVGGEKLEYILSQWQEFNKFSPVRVDYFSKERDWDDFKKLIQKPVENILEISDNAISYIYEETAGNPYFTKKICMELFTLMINNRDIHVTEKEVVESIKMARENIGATDFSHFWEDGIKGKVEKEEETSLKRRKILISITRALKSNKKITKSNISDIGIEMGLKESDIEKYLIEFEQRKILNIIANEYNFVVKFFKDWLVYGGMEKIIATFEEEERVIIFEQLEEDTRVKTAEIISLLPKLKVFKGKEITVEIIREWLDQFNDIFDQRYVFKLLENFKLYSELEVREKMELLFTHIKKELNKKGTVRFIDTNKKKRDDILVTYLDKSPAKGGTYFTKLFSDQNNIYSENVCVPELLTKKINEKKNLNGIIVIDDFLGSGNTMLENIKNYFDGDLIKLITEKNVLVIFGILTGFLGAKEYLEEYLKNLNFEFSVKVIDILNESDKCFSESSSIFLNHAERKRTKQICLQKGESLEGKNPLGYSNCQALISFPLNCPNNTLPIFWKRTNRWVPLFERN